LSEPGDQVGKELLAFTQRLSAGSEIHTGSIEYGGDSCGEQTLCSEPSTAGGLHDALRGRMADACYLP
jgi:hypothetical protein